MCHWQTPERSSTNVNILSPFLIIDVMLRVSRLIGPIAPHHIKVMLQGREGVDLEDVEVQEARQG